MGWMRLGGTIGGHPVTPSSVELRAGDKLGTGTGMDTACAALEVAVKAGRALRPSWNVPEAVVSFREGLLKSKSLFVHTNQKVKLLHPNTNRAQPALAPAWVGGKAGTPHCCWF